MRRRVFLASLLALMVFSQPVLAESNALSSPIMQGSTTNLQPSYENNTMYLFGKASANPCWGHFNNTDEGSDPDGYGGESTSSGRLSISWSCRMDPILGVDFELEVDKTIDLNLYFEGWGNTGSDCSGEPCKNLNLSFTKGGKPIAEKEIEIVGDGPFQVNWGILVNEDIAMWKKSEDNPVLDIEVELEAIGGTFLGIFNEDADFYIYYTHPEEDRQYPYDTQSDGDNSTITFPILEDSVVDPEVESEGGNGDGAEDSPGFGMLITGASVLWAALFLNKKKSVDE